nr:hypothetical protein CFP56_52039 [Quercus suber]
MSKMGFSFQPLMGGGDEIERNGGDELQIGSNENEIQGLDLCLALTTSFSGDKNEMIRLRSMFAGDDELQKATMSRVMRFSQVQALSLRWRWVGEDED